MYSHNESIDEFQEAISEVLEDKLWSKIKFCGLFSVMIDESTDVSVHQNLLVSIRLLEQVKSRLKLVTYFLRVRQLKKMLKRRVSQHSY